LSESFGLRAMTSHVAAVRDICTQIELLSKSLASGLGYTYTSVCGLLARLSAPNQFPLGVCGHCTQILEMINTVTPETFNLGTWNAVGRDQIVNYYGNKQAR
jgi:hypothetical protein